MEMHKSARDRANPQAAIAVHEKRSCCRRDGCIWKSKRLGLSVDKTFDSRVRAKQEFVRILRGTLDSVSNGVGDRVELRRARFPPPQPTDRSYPEHAMAVLEQGAHHEAAVRFGAKGVAVLDFAEPSDKRARTLRASPECAVTILEKA